MPIENDRGAQKRANPEKWIKNVKRTIRNSKEVRPKPHIACNHVNLDYCSANTLTTEDVEGEQI